MATAMVKEKCQGLKGLEKGKQKKMKRESESERKDEGKRRRRRYFGCEK